MELTCCVDVWLVGDPKVVFILLLEFFLAHFTYQYFRINVLFENPNHFQVQKVRAYGKSRETHLSGPFRWWPWSLSKIP